MRTILKNNPNIRIPNRWLKLISQSANDTTIQAYNDNVDRYLAYTPPTYNPNHAPLLKWIDFSLKNLRRGAVVLEVGSGHGRDAKYIQDKGYRVVCSDAAEAFVNYLTMNGQPALHLNVLKDNIEGAYDMVFANAVMPHFTSGELVLVLRKIYNCLPENGILAFTTKQGTGSKWIYEKRISKRFVNFWQPADLRSVLEQLGFEVTFLEHGIPGGNLAEHRWIHVTAKKLPS
jgi:SAM-dependent methyltransferase